ncbi:MAG: hypothetical protein ABJE47_00140 [bacterium]
MQPTITIQPTSRRALIVLLILLGVLILAGARSRAHARARATGTVLATRAAALPVVPAERAAKVNDDLHMEMSPRRSASAADSARAFAVAAQVRTMLAKYRDTSAATADGYKMFLPEVKRQKVYHFTNSWRATQEAFRFDPAKPTSILYTRDPDGHFTLVGAMFTAPKRFGFDKLDARVPLSIARWHKHVNWCVPRKDHPDRWLERKDGLPQFGPESPVATKAACDAVDGIFHENVFGWMLHANVMTSNDPSAIWGDEHAGHDMHDGMKMDPGM